VAERKPLVLNDDLHVAELPDGDTVEGATGGPGTMIYNRITATGDVRATAGYADLRSTE
jgi:hypothetical protein